MTFDVSWTFSAAHIDMIILYRMILLYRMYSNERHRCIYTCTISQVV